MMMMMIYIWLFLNFFVESIHTFKRAQSFRYTNRQQTQPYTITNSFFDDSIDISDAGDGGVLKRLLRRGDPRKAAPRTKDMVNIEWKLYLVDGTLIHDSKANRGPEDEIFSFTIGAEPREVIIGWELALKTMLEGEIASFTIDQIYGFGVNGAPPLVPENTKTIVCDIELLKIIPALSRRYKSVGVDESIKEELMEEIYSGKSVIAEEAMKNKVINETKSKDEMKFYDPKIHTLDPKCRVTGQGRGHSWEETMTSIDIDIPLEYLVSKYDVDVIIKPTTVAVKLLSSGGGLLPQTLLEGPLHGKVLPSTSMWVLLEPDPTNAYKGPILRISLEKGFGSKDIWATVLDRTFLKEQQEMQ